MAGLKCYDIHDFNIISLVAMLNMNY